MKDPAAGLERYEVGGAVRDALLGEPVHDHDWVVVGASVDDMLARGFTPVGSDFPVFLHPLDGSEHALARTERKTGPGHGGFECISDASVTLEQDLARRDFTINAIARRPDGTLVDPFGGQADLAARVLRHVSSAFNEDPLRVLRGARFAAQLAPYGFTLAPETVELMRAMAAGGELQTLTPERVWQETARAHGCPQPRRWWEVLREVGAIPAVFPELVGGDWDARLAALEAALPLGGVDVRLAALLAAGRDDAGLLQRLRAPRRVCEVAGLAVELADTRFDALPPERLLAVLRRLDVLRRPERFAAVLLALQAAGSLNEARRVSLEALGARLGSVDVAALQARGLEGAELGRALERERLQQVRAWLAGG